MKKILYPNKAKIIGFLFLSLLFVVIGIMMIRDGDTQGWFVAIAFGFGVLVFTITLLPQASYLQLDEKGFELCSMFRKHHYRWEDISEFGVGRISGNKMVMFNYSATYSKQKKSRKISSALAGAEGALPDNFGMKAEALADLMNSYLENSGNPNA